MVAVASMFAVGGATAQSKSDSTIQGFEANEVHFTVDSGNRILEVRVEGCELCTKQSYLPARDIVVSEGPRILSSDAYQQVSGNSGTIMFDDTSQMVFEVNFWTPRGEGEVK
jgi:hypothetical protein